LETKDFLQITLIAHFLVYYSTPHCFAMSEDNHRLINFYTDVPAVKKILGERKDEQVQHCLLTGGTGSGKTTAAANLLALTGRVPKTFTKIHIAKNQRGNLRVVRRDDSETSVAHL
jgi:hypothetical protein